MRATRTASALNAEINVTPLVDVCLVLLIIFMLFLPAMTGDNVHVQLPEAAKSPGVDKRMFPITVKDDGTVYLDQLIVRREEVAAALRRLHATAASRPIGVRGDKRVLYGDIVDVLEASRNAGWQDVVLVTIERK